LQTSAVEIQLPIVLAALVGEVLAVAGVLANFLTRFASVTLLLS
jgi:uncharacterized membrane protein YphA (DoxX/SURF4 family)